VLDQLRSIVGPGHVLTNPESTRRYRTEFRFGLGPALAVVRPGSLIEQWRLLKACVAATSSWQAANTGLTGGSTPDGSDYDREIVIVSTLRMAKIRLIDDGRQVICLPGATLFQLENALKPLGRDPHSVIGSSCIGASVFGGILAAQLEAARLPAVGVRIPYPLIPGIRGHRRSRMRRIGYPWVPAFAWPGRQHSRTK